MNMPYQIPTRAKDLVAYNPTISIPLRLQKMRCFIDIVGTWFNGWLVRPDCESHWHFFASYVGDHFHMLGKDSDLSHSLALYRLVCVVACGPPRVILIPVTTKNMLIIYLLCPWFPLHNLFITRWQTDSMICIVHPFFICTVQALQPLTFIRKAHNTFESNQSTVSVLQFLALPWLYEGRRPPSSSRDYFRNNRSAYKLVD